MGLGAPGPATASPSPVDYAQPDIESIADTLTRQHPAHKRVKSTLLRHIRKGVQKGAAAANKLSIKSGRRSRAGSMRRGKAT